MAEQLHADVASIIDSAQGSKRFFEIDFTETGLEVMVESRHLFRNGP